MGCDVDQYLPDCDNPVADVEKLVHKKMSMYPRMRQRRRRQGFLPPSAMEFAVFSEDGDVLNVTAYRKNGNEFYVELHHQENTLRKFHTHNGHKNPRPKRELVDGVHMHFPTIRYPLYYGRSSYAYSIMDPEIEDVADSVYSFCLELDIEISAIQPLLGGG